MHPRNRLFFLAAGLALLISAALAQSSAPPAQPQAPPSYPATNQQAPAPQAPAAAQSAPTQAQPGQPSQAPVQAEPQPSTPTYQNNKDSVQIPSQGQGQEPTTTDSGVFVFKKNVDEVVLHATVVDEKGRLVTNLNKSAFQVMENGVPQQITHFSQEDIPVALGILIDNSGSMRDKRAQVNVASLDLVKASNPDDRVFIVNFNDEYYLDQDFTSNLNQLKEGLEHIESRGGTALYDALIASADHLKRNSPPKLEKKVLLVVTDGEDNSSRDSLEQAVRMVSQEGGPTIYTIGILGDEHTKRAKRALTALSEQTGGLAFFPKDASEVDQIARTVARDIRNQYTIVFKKNANAPAGYRTVKVVARAPGYKNLQVRTLTGYYAGQDRASR